MSKAFGIKISFTRKTFKKIERNLSGGVPQGAFNSAEVQQCRKRWENFRINYTHFLKSRKLLTLITKENHSNFGANISATAN